MENSESIKNCDEVLRKKITTHLEQFQTNIAHIVAKTVELATEHLTRISNEIRQTKLLSAEFSKLNGVYVILRLLMCNV